MHQPYPPHPCGSSAGKLAIHTTCLPLPSKPFKSHYFKGSLRQSTINGLHCLKTALAQIPAKLSKRGTRLKNAPSQAKQTRTWIAQKLKQQKVSEANCTVTAKQARHFVHPSGKDILSISASAGMGGQQRKCENSEDTRRMKTCGTTLLPCYEYCTSIHMKIHTAATVACALLTQHEIKIPLQHPLASTTEQL